jgi:hypothetical protein
MVQVSVLKSRHEEDRSLWQRPRRTLPLSPLHRLKSCAELFCRKSSIVLSAASIPPFAGFSTFSTREKGWPAETGIKLAFRSEIKLSRCLHLLLQGFVNRLIGLADQTGRGCHRKRRLLTLLSDIRVQTARFLVQYRWNRSQRMILRWQYFALIRSELHQKVIKSFFGICQECWHWRVPRNPPDSVDDFDQTSVEAISRFDTAVQLVSNCLPSKSICAGYSNGILRIGSESEFSLAIKIHRAGRLSLCSFSVLWPNTIEQFAFRKLVDDLARLIRGLRLVAILKKFTTGFFRRTFLPVSYFASCFQGIYGYLFVEDSLTAHLIFPESFSPANTFELVRTNYGIFLQSLAHL